MNWRHIAKNIQEKYWDFINIELKFSPFSQSEKIDYLKFEKQYDLSSHYNDGYNEDYVIDLHEKVIAAFVNITDAEERIYALSWQHEGYSFDPRMNFEMNEFDEWIIDVFANGDYNFFITSDFENYLFADGVSMKIMYSGKALVDFLNNNTPVMFQEPGT